MIEATRFTPRTFAQGLENWSSGDGVAGDPKKLRNLNNSTNIQAGSLVEVNGVGSEIYMNSVNINTGEATLSKALYDAEVTQDFTFTNFFYMLDFSGFDQLQKFTLQNVNPLRLTHHQNSAATLWSIDAAQRLPFRAQCLYANTLIAKSSILTPSGARRHTLPYY
ncbi:hypothetical protein N9C22_02490 [Paracoccaceae bacterium]|nr:hypothetical protein [Paracoccaceae bacterium]